MPVPRLRIDDTAILIIDLQERLLPSIVDADRIVNNCRILIRMADELRMPYLVTEQYPKGLGRTVDIIAAAMADPSRRVEKTRFSAAVELIEEHLDHWCRGTLLIGGLEAHVCVLQTVLDFQAGGRQCFVCSDAVSSGQRDQVLPALDRMQGSGAVVTGVMSALYELLGDSRHPAFGSCLELAKAVQF